MVRKTLPPLLKRGGSRSGLVGVGPKNEHEKKNHGQIEWRESDWKGFLLFWFSFLFFWVVGGDVCVWGGGFGLIRSAIIVISTVT